MNGDLTKADVQPFSKETQLARKERRYRRKIASPKRWSAIADAKQGVCRTCGAPPPNELHHLVARAHGGADSESNIAPLCRICHALVEARDRQTCERLVLSFTDAEYAYVVEVGGESYLERRYSITYGRPA